ncbi:uncharacterized protein TrAtP1_010471 [Trichoderma atroviride]|uniref:uncharacterized protein n=1 Tax=Hypocrea atroviridis TaxID=63577 RepID=UPI00332A4184|nr:hypothetical protein TrAtP1_010471 [Trichoderma atroviride]
MGSDWPDHQKPSRLGLRLRGTRHRSATSIPANLAASTLERPIFFSFFRHSSLVETITAACPTVRTCPFTRKWYCLIHVLTDSPTATFFAVKAQLAFLFSSCPKDPTRETHKR